MGPWLADAAKEFVALAASVCSILIGLACAVAAFELALAISFALWLLIPCLIAAALTPVFLVGLPGLFYRWRYGFPIARRGGSSHLVRLRKSAAF